MLTLVLSSHSHLLSCLYYHRYPLTALYYNKKIMFLVIKKSNLGGVPQSSSSSHHFSCTSLTDDSLVTVDASLSCERNTTQLSDKSKVLCSAKNDLILWYNNGYTFWYYIDTFDVRNRKCAIIDDRVTLHGDSRSVLAGRELKSTIYKQEAQTEGNTGKNPVHEGRCFTTDS